MSARRAFNAGCAAFVAAASLTAHDASSGLRLMGASLVAINVFFAAWDFDFDA